ncbi:hypothetical protein ALC57_17937 [Trachymyrmex cornetzi]|uniref:Uncharacterized protein n=1 Tax=Trachymyrmex cornetzi TaxID=471704 RepID=A0A195DAK2_9HYME|nr:hypothetical protein ALC57_17937 [Trachymyrmex cornetzi]
MDKAGAASRRRREGVVG